MDKNRAALTPPMGWNSYDYYDTTVTEEQVKQNANYMAANLRQFGWEYIVVDIQWYAYDAGSQRDSHQYLPFWNVAMDAYSRLVPCPDRFPSSAGGQGFKPLADYVHSLGLKFGIHIMRGIPRQAAHSHGRILGTEVTANEIADPSNICLWNPDMYGLRTDRQESQAYYNSIFDLYAAWGVDFVKCDDICRMDMPSAKKEIEMLYQAIQHCNRPMVLSLSPGPALLDEASHYKQYANMWRITDDFWDDWRFVADMFVRCEQWQTHVEPGCFPDCDMLPLCYIGKGFGEERYTRFTQDEQQSMMTLWCIFRSPLMLGAELTKLDDWTKTLITNPKVLRLITHSTDARQIRRDERQAVWFSKDIEGQVSYLAMFNLEDTPQKIAVADDELGTNAVCGSAIEELWSGEIWMSSDACVHATIPPHGTRLYRIERSSQL